MPLYASGDYALSWGTVQFRNRHVRTSQHLTGLLADLKDVKVTLDPTSRRGAMGTAPGPAASSRRKAPGRTVRSWNSSAGTARSGIRRTGNGSSGTSIWRRPRSTPPSSRLLHPPHGPDRHPTASAAACSAAFRRRVLRLRQWAIRHDQHATLEPTSTCSREPRPSSADRRHCDERGGETYNFGLGEPPRRGGEEVLVAKGIDPGAPGHRLVRQEEAFEAGTGSRSGARTAARTSSSWRSSLGEYSGTPLIIRSDRRVTPRARVLQQRLEARVRSRSEVSDLAYQASPEIAAVRAVGHDDDP